MSLLSFELLFTLKLLECAYLSRELGGGILLDTETLRKVQEAIHSEKKELSQIISCDDTSRQ